MGSSEAIKHSGEIIRIEADRVYVRMSVGSACSACHARMACGASEQQEKVVEVLTFQSDKYHIGEKVEVALQNRSMGVKSVVMAYVIPLLVLCGVLFGAVAAGITDGLSALLALCSVALYYVVLYLLRGKMEKEIKFIIIK